MGGSPKTDGTSAIDGEARKLGFGEFADWAYAEVIMRRKGYAQFLLAGGRIPIPGKETIHRSDSIQRSRNHNGCQHCSSGVGNEEHAYSRGGLGFLIIPMGYREENHFGEDYLRVSNLY